MKRLILAALLCTAGPALAGTLATGSEITAAIAGNTVQGRMVDAGANTEFYMADGTIKGADYAGKWTVEGDKMCFAYDGPTDCFSVRLSGEMVTWVKDGADTGIGTIVDGNPNSY